MGKIENYTDRLVEKVYYCHEQENEENIQRKIDEFLTELSNRRRAEPCKGGLQAEIVVMPDAFAAKVNENNGYGSHIISGLNLYKCIKHETKFYTENAFQNYGLVSKDTSEIIKNGLEIRILDGKNTIMVAIASNNNIKSKYQLKVVKKLVDKLKDMQSQRVYTHVKVGMNTPITFLELDDVKRYAYENLQKAIENEERKLEERNFQDLER